MSEVVKVQRVQAAVMALCAALPASAPTPRTICTSESRFPPTVMVPVVGSAPTLEPVEEVPFPAVVELLPTRVELSEEEVEEEVTARWVVVVVVVVVGACQGVVVVVGACQVVGGATQREVVVVLFQHAASVRVRLV